MSDPHETGITRREAVVRITQVGLAAAAVGTGSVFFTERRVAQAAAPAIRDWRRGAFGIPLSWRQWRPSKQDPRCTGG